VELTDVLNGTPVRAGAPMRLGARSIRLFAAGR
jgi:hypothetical protein